MYTLRFFGQFSLLSLTLLAFWSCEKKEEFQTPVITEITRDNHQTPPPSTEAEVQNPAPETTTSTVSTTASADLAVPEYTGGDVEIGKRLYLANCISCHHKDPNQSGSLGPSQVHAPWPVFYVKVLTGRYPENLDGYSPQRKTKAMRKFTNLKDDIKHLYAWIQSQKK
jgi:mono/diheme cytochrome c family protein